MPRDDTLWAEGNFVNALLQLIVHLYVRYFEMVLADMGRLRVFKPKATIDLTPGRREVSLKVSHMVTTTLLYHSLLQLHLLWLK